MVKGIRKEIEEILIKGGLVTEKDLARALKIQRTKGGSLGRILVKEGLLSDRDLLVALSQGLKIPPLDLSRYKIDPDVAHIIPERIARYYHLIPISQLGNALTIAMADPLNIFAIDDIKVLTRYEIDLVVATDRDILEAIERSYGGGESETISNVLKESAQAEEEEEDSSLEVLEEEKIDVTEITKESQTAPIVRMVNLILVEALKKRASDIHIEPCEDRLRVRYRIDGNLHDVLTIPKKNQNAVLARLKIMSKLDITESRLTQDGRFKIKLDGKEVDFRVSVLPISHGGKVVLRALDKSNLSIGLDKLGFLPQPLAMFQEAIARPYGMILVTGPTGSGKSTSLYSVINQLNTPERNIITVEDPVEYQVEGLTQLQVQPEIGLTFSSGLRSLLRQSPDVILIGEIRDAETADIAIKASLTGQLVFSTLHTNDAAGAITRLMDMGIEPFLIASSLIMIAAQRLCRKICPHCKEPYDIPEETFKNLGIKVPAREDGKPIKFYRGKGCKSCNNTGYYGRMGTLETLMVDDKIREMIINRASTDKIKEYALSRGMRTLRENALQKFFNGDTTLEEVLRITTEE